MLRLNILAVGLAALPWLNISLVASLPSQKPASLEFEAVPIDGDPFSGRLLTIESPWRLALLNSERKTFDGGDLVSLRRKGQPQVVSVSGAQVLLANGDCIRATAQRATQEVLWVNSELFGNLEIPLERVQGIVLNAPQEPGMREKFIGSLASQHRKQDVVVMANGDELHGSLLGLDENAIQLRAAQGDTAINRNGVQAIALSSELISFPMPQGLYAKITLSDGSELALLDGRIDGTKLRGRSAFDRAVTVPLEQLIAIEFRNGRLTYLSDLEYSEYRHTPYLGARFPLACDRSVLGNAISLRGRVFRKGLGMHSRSELTYPLAGKYRRFEAVVGIDDETGGQGSAVFRVLRDGQPDWESPPLTGQMAPQRIQLDMTGTRQLTLIVDFGALGDVQDHADWADARLIR